MMRPLHAPRSLRKSPQSVRYSYSLPWRPKGIISRTLATQIADLLLTLILAHVASGQTVGNVLLTKARGDPSSILVQTSSC